MYLTEQTFRSPYAPCGKSAPPLTGGPNGEQGLRLGQA